VKQLHLLPSAQRDLDAIWDYTANAWGIDQAESYVTALRRDMEQLREYPQLGVVHASRHASFRKLPSGHHFIYYVIAGAGVEVVRVLHERMDVARLLSG